ncbi:MAG: hypothetical protein PGMFKBFP_02553 [Anaerolineales bacterium]|nr:hypothetical protein [Anaerolineales bacterium]
MVVEEKGEGEVRAPQSEEERARGFAVHEEETEEREREGEETDHVPDHLRPAEVHGGRDEQRGDEASAELLTEEAARQAVDHPARAGEESQRGHRPDLPVAEEAAQGGASERRAQRPADDEERGVEFDEDGKAAEDGGEEDIKPGS